MLASLQNPPSTSERKISQSISDVKSVVSIPSSPFNNSTQQITKSTPTETRPLSAAIVPSTPKSQAESNLSRQESKLVSVLSPLQSQTTSVVSPPLPSPIPSSPSASTISQPSFERSESKPTSSIVSSKIQSSTPLPRTISKSSSSKTSSTSSRVSSKTGNSMTSSFEAKKSSDTSPANTPRALLNGFLRPTNSSEPKSTTFQGRKTRSASGSERSTRSTPAKTNGNSGKDTGLSKFAALFSGPKSQGNNTGNTFERVDTHTGKTTYLGRGTISQVEDCLRNCLGDHDRGKHSLIFDLHHSSGKCLTRASVLEDYSYDGIVCGRNPRRIVVLDDCPSICDRKLSANDLSLKEIRQVNDALVRQGISVFSEERHSFHPDGKRHTVGELLSACRVLMDDPTIAMQQHHVDAAKHVWDHIHNYPGGVGPQQNLQFGRPGSPNPSVYSTPSFMPGAPPAPPSFMSGPPQAPPSFMSGPPQAPPSFMSGPPPPSYPPMINANSYMPGPPAQQSGPPSAARNVLASLFSGRSN